MGRQKVAARGELFDCRHTCTGGSVMAEKKTKKKYSLRVVILVIGVSALLAGDIGYNIATSNFRNTPTYVSAATEQPLIDYINKVRADHGVAPLKEDTVLDQTAKLKAEDMAARNYRDHTTPDGKPFYSLLQQYRPNLKFYGENLAECQTNTPETVAQWVASPGHLNNMIEPRFNVFGSYVVWDSDQSCMITVNHFGQE